MCKHILFNNFDKKDIPTIHRFADMTHDKDGFGMIARLKNGDIKTIKSVNMAGFYMELSKIITLYKVADLVVHHRTSTNGRGVNYSHPFEFQGNFLTHNGVVTVPGTHETKTTNDSEALLHHLIKTDYETLSISGYYSCFILNKDETKILVDATAPIYSDGRIYSSHNITGEWLKIEKKLITIPVGGAIKVERDIEVMESSYGLDKAYLSLGRSFDNFTWQASDYLQDARDTFFDCLTGSDESYLESQGSKRDTILAIREISKEMGLRLTKKEVKDIYNSLFNVSVAAS